MVTKHFLFIILKEEENFHGRKTKIGPKNVIYLTCPVLPDGDRKAVQLSEHDLFNKSDSPFLASGLHLAMY